jgi:hypothetical protein
MCATVGPMKSTLAAILVALSLVGSAFAKPAKPAPKPVSGYMRSVGILYLETVEELDCEKSVELDKCLSRWESTLNRLEDRIEIALSQSKRPSGDKPFLDLLRAARYARMFYARADSDNLDKKAWAHAWVVCSSHAHTVAVEGEYFDGDGAECSDAISQASK